ncbi:polyhydroxyalkanoate biosynthesis repressor PhaR [Arthrobacter citreus]|nr:polyhydroxyalkanoate biosynthesis repressor PhaR [Arthrobacter citreus]
MKSEKTINPYGMFSKLYGQWETQVNDIISLSTNNKEFVKLAGVTSDTTARYQERLNKTQELLANHLNLPTKVDIANLAKLTIQSEEKLDSMEEEIWELKNTVDSSNRDNQNLVRLTNETIKLMKQHKTELMKTKQELIELKELRSEIQDIKNELSNFYGLKEEISILLMFMNERNKEKPVEQELELTFSNSK